MNQRAVGSKWELKAKVMLEQQGYQIIEMNYRCRQGEIDLIGYDGSILCFIEVKFRKHSNCGTPGEAITPQKQKRISQAAKYYLYQKQLAEDIPCRYDAVLITDETMELIKNAFGGMA